MDIFTKQQFQSHTWGHAHFFQEMWEREQTKVEEKNLTHSVGGKISFQSPKDAGNLNAYYFKFISRE